MYLQYNKGNIQDSIKISDMEQGIVIVPPLDEQRIISKFLDDNISKIDYLATGLLIFTVVGIGAFVFIVKRSHRNNKRRR